MSEETRKSPARCVAVLGTGSDVGKSMVATALCRILREKGYHAAPFKAQNMSNNSFVTREGGEMGRAQVVQAEAAGVEPHTDMNPVLLKPCTDTGCQVVLHGRAVGNQEAAGYFADTRKMFSAARASLKRLRAVHDVIVMEGAGSCAEVNLRARDFVNFRMAHAACAPVILVADIDRGGVFAQIVGTLAVLPPKDRRRVAGIIINKFRGDAALFQDGMDWIEQRTGLPVLGLIPYFRHIEIDSEDGLPLDIIIDPPAVPTPEFINLAVLRLPHISNFTDFAPLGRSKEVSLHYLARPRDLSGYDAVFLPGSKHVRADLHWLRSLGWDARLQEFAAGGGNIMGICGGYQMLGLEINDPHGVEGRPGASAGLGLLPIRTVLEKDKVLARVRARCNTSGQVVEGYEIHMGRTGLLTGAIPAFTVHERQGKQVMEPDGARGAQGNIRGSYIHGLFDLPGFRNSFLRAFKPGYEPARADAAESAQSAFKEQQYHLLADHFRRHLDMEALMRIIGLESVRESMQTGVPQ